MIANCNGMLALTIRSRNPDALACICFFVSKARLLSQLAWNMRETFTEDAEQSYQGTGIICSPMQITRRFVDPTCHSDPCGQDHSTHLFRGIATSCAVIKSCTQIRQDCYENGSRDRLGRITLHQTETLSQLPRVI